MHDNLLVGGFTGDYYVFCTNGLFQFAKYEILLFLFNNFPSERIYFDIKNMILRFVVVSNVPTPFIGI